MSMHAVNEHAESAFPMLMQEKAWGGLAKMLAIKIAGEIWC